MVELENKKVFMGGVPTDIEIRRLREKYPETDLAEGQIITHEEIESIIQERRDSYRYKTVTLRWRKLVEHLSGKILGPVLGVGLKVLNDGEKVTLSSSKLKSAGRLSRRSYNVLSLVDTKALNKQELVEYDHSLKNSASIMMISKLKSKTILPAI